MSCGVGRRLGSNPKLLWLWCRPVAAALILSLAWELSYAEGAPLKHIHTHRQSLMSILQVWSRKEKKIPNEIFKGGRGRGIKEGNRIMQMYGSYRRRNSPQAQLTAWGRGMTTALGIYVESQFQRKWKRMETKSQALRLIGIREKCRPPCP